MNIALWAIQGILALTFLLAGFMKTFMPLATLKKSLSWVNSTPAIYVRLLGVAELLGAIGLILPGITGILPWLIIAAAVGAAIVMVGACIVHASQREYSTIIVTGVLLLMAVLIVVGRLAFVPLV
jgi:hypothetical protein